MTDESLKFDDWIKDDNSDISSSVMAFASHLSLIKNLDINLNKCFLSRFFHNSEEETTTGVLKLDEPVRSEIKHFREFVTAIERKRNLHCHIFFDDNFSMVEPVFRPQIRNSKELTL
jgi:hypothetical protein